MVWECGSRQGGFACLARAQEGHHRVFGGQREQLFLDGSRDHDRTVPYAMMDYKSGITYFGLIATLRRIPLIDPLPSRGGQASQRTR